MLGLVSEIMEDQENVSEIEDTNYNLPKLKKIAQYVTYHKNDAKMTQQEMRELPISDW
jgi:hypothetical protein